MMLQVWVKPNSRQQRIEKAADGSLIVHLKSSPIEGKANQESIALLAKQFKVPKSCVSIQAGLKSRHQRVQIETTSSGASNLHKEVAIAPKTYNSGNSHKTKGDSGYRAGATQRHKTDSA